MTSEAQTAATGALARNILYFARALREAGVPVGPGAVLDAIAAVEAVGVGDRADFRETLHAVLVKSHEHTLLFDQAFDTILAAQGLARKNARNDDALGAMPARAILASRSRARRGSPTRCSRRGKRSPSRRPRSNSTRASPCRRTKSCAQRTSRK